MHRTGRSAFSTSFMLVQEQERWSYELGQTRERREGDSNCLICRFDVFSGTRYSYRLTSCRVGGPIWRFFDDESCWRSYSEVYMHRLRREDVQSFWTLKFLRSLNPPSCVTKSNMKKIMLHLLGKRKRIEDRSEWETAFFHHGKTWGKIEMRTKQKHQKNLTKKFLENIGVFKALISVDRRYCS